MAKVKVKDTVFGKKIKLTLSPEEAGTILTVVRNIGGAMCTPRGYTDNIRVALEDAKVPPILANLNGYSGAIVFTGGII